jgi:hypothetical protein
MAATMTNQEIPTAEAARFWMQEMSRFPIEAVTWAFQEHLRSALFFPKLPEITALCEDWIAKKRMEKKPTPAEEIALWRKDREEHPEKYATFADVAQMAQEVIAMHTPPKDEPDHEQEVRNATAESMISELAPDWDEMP